MRRAAAWAALAFVCTAAHATDLRGTVTGGPYASPRTGAVVTLQTPDNVVVQRATTDGAGFYYFRAVKPGSYVLLVGPRRFTFVAGNTPTQDLPAIKLP